MDLLSTEWTYSGSAYSPSWTFKSSTIFRLFFWPVFYRWKTSSPNYFLNLFFNKILFIRLVHVQRVSLSSKFCHIVEPHLSLTKIRISLKIQLLSLVQYQDKNKSRRRKLNVMTTLYRTRCLFNTKRTEVGTKDTKQRGTFIVEIWRYFSTNPIGDVKKSTGLEIGF